MQDRDKHLAVAKFLKKILPKRCEEDGSMFVYGKANIDGSVYTICVEWNGELKENMPVLVYPLAQWAPRDIFKPRSNIYLKCEDYQEMVELIFV